MGQSRQTVPHDQPPPPLPIGERELVVMLAMSQALQAMAIDAMLPALGLMSADLRLADANDRQLVISVFLFGMGVGALLPGPLSDRFGRRKVLLGALAIYVALMVACALTQSFAVLVALRFVQALGSSALGIMPAAIIRDRFEGDRMARLQSLIAVIFFIVPMLAPTVGQAIAEVAGWRAIFWLMAASGVVMALWIGLRLPETLNPGHRQPLGFGHVGRTMREVLLTRSSIGYVMASTLMMSAIWGYINSSQQLIAEHFHAGRLFPMIFGGIALAMAIGNLVNSRIVEKFGTRRVSHTALLAFIALAAAQVWNAFHPPQSLVPFALLMAANLGLLGFTGANFTAIALQPFGRQAGSASSLHSFLRSASAGIIGGLIGQAYDGTPRPIALALLLAGLAALGFILFSERGVLFRRLNPPRPLA